jgi:hypothetical protein
LDARPVLERLEDLVLPSGFVVNNTNDYGPGSLSQALEDSNSPAGPNTISFAIPGPGVHTIAPESVFPSLSTPVTLDGTTQPGCAGWPLIELDGTKDGQHGLNITASGCVIRGLMLAEKDERESRTGFFAKCRRSGCRRSSCSRQAPAIVKSRPWPASANGPLSG